jgi:hypothetical protein
MCFHPGVHICVDQRQFRVVAEEHSDIHFFGLSVLTYQTALYR